MSTNEAGNSLFVVFEAVCQISGSLSHLCLVHLCASCRRGHFLFFTSPKKGSKERRLRAQVWLRQTSLTPHGFSGRLATCGCVASGMQALISRKTALHSAAPAEQAQPQPFSPHILRLISQKANSQLRWYSCFQVASNTAVRLPETFSTLPRNPNQWPYWPPHRGAGVCR